MPEDTAIVATIRTAVSGKLYGFQTNLLQDWSGPGATTSSRLRQSDSTAGSDVLVKQTHQRPIQRQRYS